jgi:hypothetical protein
MRERLASWRSSLEIQWNPDRLRHLVALPGLLLLATSGLVSSPVATAADEFPQGCVSCHMVLPDKADKRLSVVLAELGHLPIKGKVARVPADCIACHDSKVDTPFSVIVHKAHFGSPDKNEYIKRFGGDCRNCHTMDGATGQAKLKQGDVNW